MTSMVATARVGRPDVQLGRSARRCNPVEDLPGIHDPLWVDARLDGLHQRNQVAVLPATTPAIAIAMIRTNNGNLTLTEIIAKLKPAPPDPEQFLRLESAAATHEQRLGRTFGLYGFTVRPEQVAARQVGESVDRRDRRRACRRR